MVEKIGAVCLIVGGLLLAVGGIFARHLEAEKHPFGPRWAPITYSVGLSLMGLGSAIFGTTWLLANG
jgi:hypothetical protein